MKVSVKIKRSGKGFQSVADAIRPRASALVRDTTFAIEADAKARAPVLTGTLRRSIHGEMEGDLRGIVGTDLDYAATVEYGSRFQNAQPYLTPALDAARPRFQRELMEIFR